MLDGTPVAIKVLREVHRDNALAISDLESETQIMISLRHPSILRVLGVGKTGGLPFLVLEILDSILLKTLPKPAGQVSVWVRRRSVKQWPLQRALQCGIELAEALRYLHNEAMPGFQLLHRDIKPDNMGFRADGSLALFDFGLSKLVRIKAGITAHKLTGETGAPRYMAPEVAMSQPYGPSAEVYSFAIILWQLVSHQVPYAGLSSNAFHKRVVLEGARPPLGNKAWPAPLSQLFAECWSTPTERPAMEDVCRRLREMHDGLKP